MILRLILHLLVYTSSLVTLIFGDYHVISEFPHDYNCFTQGLQYYNGFLYETCGLFHRSSLRKVNAINGDVLQSYKFSNEIFAEGLVIVDNLIYVLTWMNNKVFVFDLETFTVKHHFYYSKQGWGLTYNGNHLITTDGSDKVYFLEKPAMSIISISTDSNDTKNYPKSMIEIRSIQVTDRKNGASIKMLNELEYINGSIYSNVWLEDYIYRIDPITGKGVEIDMKHLNTKRHKRDECLNGIAYNPTDNTMIVTGKLWPKYYRLHMPSHEHHHNHEGLRKQL